MPKSFRFFLLALLAALALGIAACGDDDDDGGGGGGGDAAQAEKPSIKAGLVTDIGGLNDRSFNFLANKGLEDAEADLGVEGRVLISKSNGDYVPNLTTLAQQQYDLTVSVGFLMGEATATVAGKFPDNNFAIVDFPAVGPEGQAAERRGPALQGAGGRLPRRLPRGPLGQGQQRDHRVHGRRPEDPAGGPLHRGLPEGRHGRQPAASRR